MSDNEDLLGDDLGDHSLADYNLGNDEEDQLLADDFEGSSTQNVPSALPSFREPEDIVPSDYPGHRIDYVPQPVPYQPILESESVVPNIVVEIPNLPPPHSTYAPYEPRHYEAEHSVPPAMPAALTEPPQIVPSEIVATVPNDMARERFTSERPVGAQRLPQVRDIPDSLDKVVIAGGGPRRGAWRPHHYTRTPHPYRRNNVHRATFQRNSFPPQQVRPLRPPPPMPDIRLDPLPPPPLPNIRLEITNDIRPPFQPDHAMDLPRPMEIRPPMDLPRPPMDLPRPPMDLPRPPMDLPRPGLEMNRPPFQPFQRFPFREERPMFNQVRPQFERPVYFPRQQFQRFGPPMPAKEPEVLMLPVNIPPGIAPKKVLINPHFKGTFQPPVEGLSVSIPTYIPTRIQKPPPVSPTLENKFGPIKDIDDAAERFIAEQRDALARAANRKVVRRSPPPPQRYIEDTTIEIENELARRPPRRRSDDDLLRRQEEFIHANRAGLRRRMRSPSPPAAPPRRSASPPARRDDRERRRPTNDEDTEYKRRVREQESMRERVLRAKEVRRRKNAAAYIKQMHDKDKEEKEQQQKEQQQQKELQQQRESPKEPKPSETIDKLSKTDKPVPKRRETEAKPDTTRQTPERGVSPRPDAAKGGEVNSTSGDTWTPPRVATPPAAHGSDDEVDLVLADIDGILSSDDELKDDMPKPKAEPPKPKVTDLRTRLPPKSAENKRPRLKITFNEEKEDKKKKEKSPPRKAVVSSTKTDDSEPDKKSAKTKQKQDASSNKSRQRIIFEKESAKQPDKPKQEKTSEKDKSSAFSNRRVILNQRKKETKSVFSRIEITNDPTKPNPGIFSRAVRTITERPDDTRRPDDRTNRIVIRNEPEIEYDSSGDEVDEVIGSTALVENLPHGMTDTRLKTLAGDVQSLSLDKENRTAKIAFKGPAAAESFKKKFNNKMVAASRLTVTLQ